MFALIIAITLLAAFAALCIAYHLHQSDRATQERTRTRLRTYGTRTTPTHWQ